MSKRWFISDLHFGHANIMKFHPTTRPIGSVEAMDAHMISIWNKHVGKNDLVYVVGDFSFYRDMDKNKEILAKLKGRKILIRGNHDLATTRELLDAGFEDVRDELIIKVSNAAPVLLKHYEYDYSYWVGLFKRITGKLGPWRPHYAFFPVDKGMWLIHGHHHGAPRVKGKQINVNVDSWDFRPVGENEIRKIINGYNLNRKSWYEK